MLKVRVIPTLLWKGAGLVKGVGFDSWRRVGSVLPAIRVYNRREVDELVLLDISATSENRLPDCDSISDFGQDCFVPLTYGGGIVGAEQVQFLLRAGADKISINSAAYIKPDLVREIACRFGNQSVVVSIDVRQTSKAKWKCFSHAGRRATGLEAVEWARKVEDLGAGEILLTSIERDGSFTGFDLPLIEAISARVSIPVIASGGAGSYAHMVEAVRAGASAVAAASIFHFTELTPAGAKAALAEAGFPVRQGYVGG